MRKINVFILCIIKTFMSLFKLFTLNVVFIAVLMTIWLTLDCNYFKSQPQYVNHTLIKKPVVLSGMLEDIPCDISELLHVHGLINEKLNEMRKTLFFKIFKVGMDNECNFWTQNLICNYQWCSICHCEDKEVYIPIINRYLYLGNKIAIMMS